MKTFKTVVFALVMMCAINSMSQSITGNIYELNKKKEKVPLTGASVYWLGTTVATVTDVKGNFTLTKNGISDFRLVVMYIGYSCDTTSVSKDMSSIDIEMQRSSKKLKAVNISGGNGGSYLSKISSRNVQVVTTGELYKAACCNLAESFETSASVDVSYSDAITGAKQIQLLGLSGIYSQIQAENIPSVTGMASTFGLNYIPGSWMESIQISKGTSSVINGFESITGQINVEYKKPATADRLFVNIYGNSNNRLEANVNAAHRFGKKFSGMIMFHGDDYRNKIDRNGDNFLDQPKLNTVNIFNRWDYIDPGRYISRFGFKYMIENRNGGTMDYNKNTFVYDTSAINKGTEPYGFQLDTKRAEAFWKNGIMFKDKPYKSVALILSAIDHDQSGFFGVNEYKGNEKRFYANFLYASIIGTTDHKFTTGLSYILDDYTESYKQRQFTYNYQVTGDMSTESLFTLNHTRDTTYNWNRTQSVPGAFFEYTYTYLEVLTLLAGVRVDYDKADGVFITPRMNIRYALNETTTLRASAGMGYRSANIISENLSMLASQRIIDFTEKPRQEKAVNFGMNFVKEFKVFGKKAELDIDLYRTSFINQVILDLDSTPTTAFIYNLNGRSFSNSYQVQLTYEPIKRFSVLLAYRINDVKTTIHGDLMNKPFVNNYKGLVTLSYATNLKKWQFDFTSQFNGSSRLPDQGKMPLLLRRADKSPSYIILNAQITKKFKDFDVYLGGENLTNFTQSDPITEYFRPYHTHFDTTMVWGPVVGRVIYAGFRFSIK
jgi:outer membrane receptor for ferrienterochelin and colicins